LRKPRNLRHSLFEIFRGAQDQLPVKKFDTPHMLQLHSINETRGLDVANAPVFAEYQPLYVE